MKYQNIKKSKSYEQELSNLKEENGQLKKREQELLEKLENLKI